MDLGSAFNDSEVGETGFHLRRDLYPLRGSPPAGYSRYQNQPIYRGSGLDIISKRMRR